MADRPSDAILANSRIALPAFPCLTYEVAPIPTASVRSTALGTGNSHPGGRYATLAAPRFVGCFTYVAIVPWDGRQHIPTSCDFSHQYM